MDEKLIELIAGMIKIRKKPDDIEENTGDANSMSDEYFNNIAKKIVETFNILNNSVMQLSDVTEDTISKYLAIIENINTTFTAASDNIRTGSGAIVDSLESMATSVHDTSTSIGNSAKNISIAADSIDFSKVSDNMIKSISSATAKASGIYDQFEDDLDNRAKNSTKMLQQTTILSRMVSDFFTGIQEGLKTPFRFATDIINMPKQIKAGITETISSIKTSYREFIGEAPESSNILDNNTTDEETKLSVGISNKALAVEEVLRNSTAGVAIYWLAKQLKDGAVLEAGKTGTGNVNTDGQSDDSLIESVTSGAIGTYLGNKFKGTFLGNILKKILPTASKYALPAGIALGTAYNMYDNYADRRSTAEVLGKRQEDVTLGDELITSSAQAYAGNVGTGSYAERGMNSLEQGLKWGTTGALIGSIVLPGIGTSVGLAVGGLAGSIAGLIGGDNFAKGIVAAKDVVVSGFEDLDSAINAGIDIRTKDTELYAETRDKLAEMNAKLSESSNLWSKFNDWLFGKKRGQGLIPTLTGNEYDNTKPGTINMENEAKRLPKVREGIDLSVPKLFGKPDYAYPIPDTNFDDNSVAVRKADRFDKIKVTRGDAEDYNYYFDADKYRDLLVGKGYSEAEANRRSQTAKNLYDEAVKLKEYKLHDLDVAAMMNQAMHETGHFNKTMSGINNYWGFKEASTAKYKWLQDDVKALGNNIEGGRSGYGVYDDLGSAITHWYLRTQNMDKSNMDVFARELKSSGYYGDSVDRYTRGLKSAENLGVIGRVRKDEDINLVKNQTPAPDLAEADRTTVDNKTVELSKSIGDAVATSMSPIADNIIKSNVKSPEQGQSTQTWQPETVAQGIANIPVSSSGDSMISANVMKYIFGINIGGAADIFAI